MSTPEPSELFAQIETLLDGIDRHEDAPRGCPLPGACSCPIVPPDLIRALELAEAALGDIGDAEREPDDDLAWAERRAAQELPRIRRALQRWSDHSTPPAAPDTTREQVKAAVADALGGSAYDCLRVWSAWGIGTMGQDDFSPIAEDGDRVAEIADAAIAALATTREPVAEESWFLEFAAWLEKEMPAGTVIGDPVWWGNRIAKRLAFEYSWPPAATREAGPLPQAGLTDEQLLELMPQQFRDDLATVSRLASYGTPVGPGLYRVSLNTGALAFARAVLARWGGATVPVPVSERPWERPGWCDAEGYCWAGYPSETENLCTSHPQWLLTNPTYIDSRKDSSADSVVLLPHWALPVPAAAAVPVAAADGRDPVCVAQWPDCRDGAYDPRCCRFPKSCSCGPLQQHAAAGEVQP